MHMYLQCTYEAERECSERSPENQRRVPELLLVALIHYRHHNDQKDRYSHNKSR